MKNLFVLAVLFVTQSAFADQSWVVESTGVNASPVANQAIVTKVNAAIDTYKKTDSNLGDLRRWSCIVTQAGETSFVEACAIILELPADWCYSGGFKLDASFDAEAITIENYEWTESND